MQIEILLPVLIYCNNRSQNNMFVNISLSLYSSCINFLKSVQQLLLIQTLMNTDTTKENS